METNKQILSKYYKRFRKKDVAVQMLDTQGNPTASLPFIQITRYKEGTVILKTVYSVSEYGTTLNLFSPTEFELAKGVEKLAKELI